MGNWGNTLDRWYHRAAIVMWPRSRSFALRAEVSPGWAVDELTRLLRKKRLPEAQEKARSLAALVFNHVGVRTPFVFDRDVVDRGRKLTRQRFDENLLARRPR